MSSPEHDGGDQYLPDDTYIDLTKSALEFDNNCRTIDAACDFLLPHTDQVITRTYDMFKDTGPRQITFTTETDVRANTAHSTVQLVENNTELAMINFDDHHDADCSVPTSGSDYESGDAIVAALNAITESEKIVGDDRLAIDLLYGLSSYLMGFKDGDEWERFLFSTRKIGERIARATVRNTSTENHRFEGEFSTGDGRVVELEKITDVKRKPQEPREANPYVWVRLRAADDGEGDTYCRDEHGDIFFHDRNYIPLGESDRAFVAESMSSVLEELAVTHQFMKPQ